MAAHAFFHTGLAGDTVQDRILDCYRLAKFYSISPVEFLALPLDEIALHMAWTRLVRDKGDAALL